jgi:decaprenylphospho-beta-D-ribofuranose 2-oxidase
VSSIVRGWGGGEGTTVSLARPESVEAFRTALRWNAVGRGAIVRGMGRAYGDAAQLSDGLVLETSRLKGISHDREAGTVTAGAGATIAELLGEGVPAGRMVPVVPGTQHVSLGGAIASDIHGKNHGTAGTFGCYVEELGLLTASGELLELRRGRDDEELAATIGGMGLTGVITWAKIRMRPVTSPFLSVDTDRVAGIDEALAALSAPGGPHRVAWLDLLGSHPGRGIVTRAEHLDASAVPAGMRGEAIVKARASVPAPWPSGVLRASTVTAFNELRFRRSPRLERGHVESIGAHMFPLDALDEWPRLYGPRGFVQYQLVVPPDQDRVLYQTIGVLRGAQVPCFLAVLKDFGPANGAHLSFPVAGWTLALDLPRAAPGLEAALQRCDELVAEAGGRVYLTKDARMRAETVRAMYPRLEQWRAIRDRLDPGGLWRSDLALRTGLVDR